MARFLGALILLLVAVYLLRGGTVGGLLDLVARLLDALAGIGRDLAPKVVHTP